MSEFFSDLGSSIDSRIQRLLFGSDTTVVRGPNNPLVTSIHADLRTDGQRQLDELLAVARYGNDFGQRIDAINMHRELSHQLMLYSRTERFLMNTLRPGGNAENMLLSMAFVPGGLQRPAQGPMMLGRRSTDGHHPLPMFLSGNRLQTKTTLDRTVHQEFHTLLRNNLQEARIPLNIGGKGGSTRDWLNYMRQNPGTQRAAFDAVLDASRAIDAKYGTKATQDVWLNIMQGNFEALP